MADADPRINALQGALADTMVRTLETVESQMDEKLRQLEEMDDEELERLRERRKDDMRNKALKRRELLSKGHGEYREIHDEKEFFKAAKDSSKVVCHFYRPTTWRCEIVDKHLLELARKHIETRFIKVNAEKVPFLVERLRIWMLPTIVLVKEGRTDHSIVGFDELGGADDFNTEDLEAKLVEHDIIKE